jgi:prepilin signal peptidase PulO-like enzyme (type II secretory pathway)
VASYWSSDDGANDSRGGECVITMADIIFNSYFFGLAGLLVGLFCVKVATDLPTAILMMASESELDSFELAPALTKRKAMVLVATTSIIWILCSLHWGEVDHGWAALSWSIFYSALLLLVVIDVRDYLLPDVITQPLIWIGLLASSLGLIDTPLVGAVQGAVAGYVGLWLIAAIYALVTSQDGMGRGDFKLMAMLGAWLGIGGLLPLAFGASLGCIVKAAIDKVFGKDGEQDFPFGPYLAAGAVMVQYFGY